MGQFQLTIFKDIHSTKEVDANYISLTTALKRIRTGKSIKQIEKIRKEKDKEKKNTLKKKLPSVVFQGKFKFRASDGLEKASGLTVIDFDDVDVVELKEDLKKDKYIFSAWVSPSGNGVKALVKIPIVSSDKEYKEYYLELLERYNIKNADKQTKDISRVCYESYDEDIYINNDASVFTNKFVVKKKEVATVSLNIDIFKNITTWLSNKGDTFRDGERNFFIFKLASACCRYGLDESDCLSMSLMTFNDSSFPDSEMIRTVKSAYSSNDFGIAEFTNDKLVDKKTGKEITTEEINPDVFNIDVAPIDVIFGEQVRDKAISILRNGYEKVDGIGVKELDDHFKMKSKEVTLLSGIGNYGKSSFLKWYLLMRILLFKDKFAIFAPEDNPAEEFYHDMTEIYFGCGCVPQNPNAPSEEEYVKVYNMISDYIFYIYPKTAAPTPEYINERFLELIIKKQVKGCVIDPFNQMSNNYASSGGRSDKYLELILSKFSRFAQTNNIYFLIVAHPKGLRKPKGEESYACPDVFDIADGAMWNNKMDNILMYHRPNHQENPNGTECEFHSKKIRRQKIVGKKGVVSFNLNRVTRRFLFNGVDPIDVFLNGGVVSNPFPSEDKPYDSNAGLTPDDSFDIEKLEEPIEKLTPEEIEKLWKE